MTHIRAVLRTVDPRDVCGVTGFGLLVYGVSGLLPEAGFIVAGLGLLAFAIMAARN